MRTKEEIILIYKKVILMKSILKKGDRVRLTHCPGTKRTITFDYFDGLWIVSKSGKNEYSPEEIDRINGIPFSYDNKLDNIELTNEYIKYIKNYDKIARFEGQEKYSPAPSILTEEDLPF